jgi:hypothetical protein
MDYRKNTQIDLFRQIYCQCDLKFLRDLNIERHIKNPQCKDSALYLINEYLQGNAHLSASKIIMSLENKSLYERWVKQR